MGEMRVLSIAGLQHGDSFPPHSFETGLSKDPHFIGADAGSTDGGPDSLATGLPGASRVGVKAAMSLLLRGARRKRIPLIVGSSGKAGGEPHLLWLRNIVEEIAREEGLHFKMALIHAEQDKEYVRRKLREGKTSPLGPVPALTEEDIDRAARIVGMMGVEPYIKALQEGADVILAGRSSDTSIFAALPLIEGFPAGLIWHMAKLIECHGLICEPQSGVSDGVFAYLRDDHFILEPTNPDKVCTTLGVAAHNLYENPSPYHIYEPSGMLDTSSAVYEQVDRRTVKVSGASFVPSDKYTIKIEGAEQYGYRTLVIGGIRDTVLIGILDDYLRVVKEEVQKRGQEMGVAPTDYQMTFHAYGRDAVMGRLEPERDQPIHEVGLLVDVVGETQDIANAIAGLARRSVLHGGFKGRLCTAGNYASPYPPIRMGPAYRFSIWHLVEPDSPYEMFPVEIVNV